MKSIKFWTENGQFELIKNTLKLTFDDGNCSIMSFENFGNFDIFKGGVRWSVMTVWPEIVMKWLVRTDFVLNLLVLL